MFGASGGIGDHVVQQALELDRVVTRCALYSGLRQSGGRWRGGWFLASFGYAQDGLRERMPFRFRGDDLAWAGAVVLARDAPISESRYGAPGNTKVQAVLATTLGSI